MIELKTVKKGAGLRVAYICAPYQYYANLERGIHSINLTLPQLNIEVATEVIRTGLNLQLIKEKQEISRQRNKLFYSIFPSVKQCLDTYCQWLLLPKSCTGRKFELQMKNKGISIFGAERFSVGDNTGSNAIRIATCSPETNEYLLLGLSAIKEMMQYSTAD